MPVTTNNIRRVYWDTDTPMEWQIRWREKGSINWNLHPFTLLVPEAIFGVSISGEPLAPGLDYIAILNPGSEYEFQIRHRCSATSFSSWTVVTDFDTYLVCPDFSGLATNWVIDYPSLTNSVEILYGYDAKGSVFYPQLKLSYKLSTDVTWVDVQYPRDGSNLVVTLPSGGSWEFKLVAKCESGTSEYSSPTYTYNLSIVLPPPENLIIRPTGRGGRVKFNPPTSQPTPVLNYQYRVDNGSWNNIGLNTVFTDTVENVGVPPTPHQYDVRAVYAGGSSSHVSINCISLPNTDTFEVNDSNNQGPWKTSGNITVTQATIDNEANTATLIATFKATGLIPNQSYYMTTSPPYSNSLMGTITNLNGAGYTPPGNYAVPEPHHTIYIGPVAIGFSYTGAIWVVGPVIADNNGEVIFNINTTWSTLQ